ncbi:uncharacterized protein LOC121416162 [Lytechinus variegatus]|uniref:uncharacterized protein LOC121416162 n=1 Tax=Lytechinus variegatus TaxID=7654 RepID=UPI001BB2231B|nr:uncharacterized protein LOC121416162 [Lytechinus variegatus]
MKDNILNPPFLLELSESIDLAVVSPANFAIYLGVSSPKGSAAVQQAILGMNPQQAYMTLLNHHVKEHGTDVNSALNLRSKLLNNRLKSIADIVDRELMKYNIPIPSHADTVIGQPLDLPTPPSDLPGNSGPRQRQVPPTTSMVRDPTSHDRQPVRPDTQPPNRPVDCVPHPSPPDHDKLPTHRFFAAIVMVTLVTVGVYLFLY